MCSRFGEGERHFFSHGMTMFSDFFHLHHPLPLPPLTSLHCPLAILFLNTPTTITTLITSLPPLLLLLQHPTHYNILNSELIMTVSNDACDLIVQAAGFVAAHILEEEDAIKTLCAGRMTIPHKGQSVHDIYQPLGYSYFWHAYRMTCKKFW